MQQINIIYLVISKWIKNVKGSILNFFIFLIALLVAINCYTQYSHIENQCIFLKTKIDCDTSFYIDSTSFQLRLNYAAIHLPIYFDGEQKKIIKNESDKSYFRYEVFSYPFMTDTMVLDRRILISTELQSYIADNSWFFLRTPGLFNRPDPEFVTTHPIGFYEGEYVEKQINSLNDTETKSEYFLGRRYYEISYNGVKGIRDFFNNIRRVDNDDDIIDSTSIQYMINDATYEPFLLSPYDISKFNLDLSLSLYSVNTDVCIFFNGLVIPHNIYPEPDVISTKSIEYHDKQKIRQIDKDGIHCLLSFPENETLQQVRLYIISAIITLLLTFLCKVMWDIIKKVYRTRKKYNRTRQNLMGLGHSDLYLNFSRLRYLANTCLCFLLFILVYSISPKDIAFSTIAYFGIIVLYIPFLSYFNSITKGVINGLSLEREYVRFVNMPIFIYIFIGLTNVIIWLIKYYRSEYYSIGKRSAFSLIEYDKFIPIILFIIAWYCWNTIKVNNFFDNIKEGTLKENNKKRFIRIAVLSVIGFAFFMYASNISFSFFVFGSLTLLIYLRYLYKKMISNL